MKKSSLIKYALIGASLPLFAGCVTHEVVYRDRPRPVVVAPAPAPAPVVVEDEAPPPPPVQVEIQTVAPGPLSAWYWAPGVWEWNGRWVWTRGHWIGRPRPGAVWYGAHWDRRGGHRVWVHGYWR
jgi:hypothetical protein